MHRALAAAPLLLLLAGLLYQGIASTADRLALSPPGRLVEVGGAAMHIHCVGSGSPTVVLQAGAIGFAQTWARVQPELARTTRVCSYDRSGLGWSESAETGHDAEAVARTLGALLERAGEPGPWVVVGHSLGGTFMQVFAGMYRDRVLGVGLVDPSHPDQLDRFPEDAREEQDRFRRMIGLAALIAPTGVLRATNIFGRLAEDLPDPAYRAARLFGSSMGHLRAASEELSAWDETMQAARRVQSLGDRPLVVLSATEPMEDMPEGFLETVHALHRELASLSSRGRRVEVAGADHYSIIMERTHALKTARVLRELVEEARMARGPAARGSRGQEHGGR